MSTIRIEPNTFEPAILSLPELRFLLEHLDEPANAALHGGNLPPGVNPIEIERHLNKFQELEQLQQFRGIAWAGFDAIRDSIERYLDWDAKANEIYRLSGGTHGQNAIPRASQFAFDDDGSAFKYAIGADSGEMVRTEILDDGSRRAFAVKLLQPEGESLVNALSQVAPWIKRGQSTAVAKTKDKVDVVKKGRHGTISCSICGKAEEFDTAVRSSYLAARARIAKHLTKTKTEINRHRLLHRMTFESRTAKV